VATEAAHPAFVLHDHRKPQPHFDLRLEENGVLRSWAVPRGLPTTTRQNRLAIAVPDHDLDHVDYTDADKAIADTGWWRSTTATSGGSCSPCTGLVAPAATP